MVYLRARYYSSDTGRFLTRDIWDGNTYEPPSLNRWSYVEGNPISFSDPTGRCRIGDQACWAKASEILSEFPNLAINMGIGSLFGCDTTIPYFTTYWTADELTDVQTGLKAIRNSITIGNANAVFSNAFGNVVLTRMSRALPPTLKDADGFTVGSNPHRVVILDLARDHNLITYTTIHEFGHVLDDRGPSGLWDQNKEDFAYSFTTVVQMLNNDNFNYTMGTISSSRFDFVIQILSTYK